MKISEPRTRRLRRTQSGASHLQKAVAARLEVEEQKTIGQLIHLIDLRQRICALHPSEDERQAIETDLDGIRQRLEHLLAASPAIAYATHASGDYACTFVSENLQTIMGYAPDEMTTDPKCWPDRLHPDDAKRARRDPRR